MGGLLTRLAVVCTAASVVVVAAPEAAPGSGTASAEAGDGAVTVRVVQEVNANGLVDSTIMEPPLAGVTVHLSDDAGNSIAADTDAAGLVTFDVGASALVGGHYRVEADNPRPDFFYPSHAANGQSAAAAAITPADLQSPTNAKLSSSVEFVDVSGDTDAFVNMAFWYPPYYCQENPTLCSASQPWTAPPAGISQPTEFTLLSVPYRFNSADQPLATNAETGTLYGIAYDRENQRIFSAAYAKRGSPYGPGGPGAIYVTDLTATEFPLAGATSVFADNLDAGADNHAMDTNQDYGFWDHVGKESLGDIDITNDNRYLFGVNMFDKTVFVYDLEDDSYVGSYDIPNPGCGDDWRPMGTGVGLDTSYVGGVCTGQTNQDMSELSAHVYQFDPATGLFGTEVVDQTLTYGRGRGYNGTYCTGAIEGGDTGRWYSWVDGFPAGPNEQRAQGCDPAFGNWVAYPTPMLGDIIEETNGDLIISFRDRFGDQMGFNATVERLDGSYTQNGEPGAGGDVIRGCKLTDGTFVLDPNLTTEALAASALCTNNNDGSTDNGSQPETYREFYTGDWRTGYHEEAFYGGVALARSEVNLTGTGFDSTGAVWTQGVGAISRGGALPSGNLGVRTDDGTVDEFGKGSGMADLEVLCDKAPIQIGNRVWLDVDEDGVQDPGETPIEGATVNLYDADGNLVGTTTTSANGEYFFDQTNVTDGATQGLTELTDYVVRLDEPTDYEAGGPLYAMRPTVADAGGDDELDSDGITATDGYPEAAVTTGEAGVDDHTYDFGFVLPSVSVGDFVWVDTDRDGIQDAAEPGIPGVWLELTDADGNPVTDVYGVEVEPVQTDADGFYEFPSLPAGESYTVTISTTTPQPALEPYVPTVAGDGSSPATDSSTGSATSVVLPNDGDSDMTLDFGFVTPSVSVGDYVWVDTDGDGIQDDGEPGIPNVTLTLTGPDGNPVTDVFGDEVLPTQTDGDGLYEFPNLPALDPGESYTVTVTPPPGYDPTVPGDGSNPATDSSTGSAESGDLTTNGAHDPTLDFGFVEDVVSIGDYVWIDADRDGVQDAGETPVPDAPVRLLDPDGNEVATTTTDANGYYVFTDLPASTDYLVEFPTSVVVGAQTYDLTQPDQGADDALDSDADPATGRVAVTTPMSGDNSDQPGQADDPTIDAGFVPVVSIGDYVWIDADRDGVQDAGETPVPDAPVRLLDPDGNEVATTTTDADGYYAFTDLVPSGEYVVEFPTTADIGGTTYVLTQPDQGDDASDSDADPTTGRVSVTAPASGSNSSLPGEADDPTIDAGFVSPSVSVGDYVWVDTDRDGVQDPGEPGIPGVTLTLTGPDGEPVTDVFGEPVLPTQTDGDGLYEFPNLPALPAGESYTVTVTPPAGYVPTVPGAGSDSAADSSTGSASSGDLTTDGAHDPTLDFGFVTPSVSVGDYVWVDTDRDGVQDPGEPGIPGVTLTLTGPDGNPVTDVFGEPVLPTQTDGDGLYEFPNLPALPAGESYTVTVTPPAGYVPTAAGAGSDPAADSSTGSASSGDLTTDGAHDPTLDFGFVPPAVSVGDYVWLDADRDGVQDAGEPGIGGVLLTLTGPDGDAVTDVNGNPVAPVRTAADGSYLFDLLPVLPAGEHYTVTVSSPGSDPVRIEGTPAPVSFSTIKPTAPGSGSDRAVDSSTGSAESGDLTDNGAHDPTLDFGFVVPSVDVGGHLWRDDDGDAAIDPGEPPIPGVLLKITGPDGNPVTDVNGDPVEPVRTGSDGSYEFGDLPVLEPGESYTVAIVEGDAPTIAALDGLELTTTAWQLPATGLTEDQQSVNDLDFGFQPAAVPTPPATTPPTVPTTPPTPGELPATGGNSGLTLQLTALLLAAGLGLVVFARRRRRIA